MDNKAIDRLIRRYKMRAYVCKAHGNPVGLCSFLYKQNICGYISDRQYDYIREKIWNLIDKKNRICYNNEISDYKKFKFIPGVHEAKTVYAWKPSNIGPRIAFLKKLKQ